jgi:SAM-dependent methyltransferase
VGGRLPADRPHIGWMNTVLRTRREVEEAVREVDRCGLVRHPDRPKHWDAIGAVRIILQRTTQHARVLEMGARSYSVILRWLYQYGYRNLIGIDLIYREAIRRGPIRYEFGDLTRTQFADRSFDVICAMSVIEHGVDPALYFAEAARLLIPGGLLITSTDCWKAPVDTRGQLAYGVPIKIYTMDEIARMIVTAETFGLRPTSQINLNCEEPAVTWQRYGLDFTFVCFALLREQSKKAEGDAPQLNSGDFMQDRGGGRKG